MVLCLIPDRPRRGLSLRVGRLSTGSISGTEMSTRSSKAQFCSATPTTNLDRLLGTSISNWDGCSFHAGRRALSYPGSRISKGQFAPRLGHFRVPTAQRPCAGGATARVAAAAAQPSIRRDGVAQRVWRPGRRRCGDGDLQRGMRPGARAGSAQFGGHRTGRSDHHRARHGRAKAPLSAGAPQR